MKHRIESLVIAVGVLRLREGDEVGAVSIMEDKYLQGRKIGNVSVIWVTQRLREGKEITSKQRIKNGLNAVGREALPAEPETVEREKKLQAIRPPRSDIKNSQVEANHRGIMDDTTIHCHPPEKEVEDAQYNFEVEANHLPNSIGGEGVGRGR